MIGRLLQRHHVVLWSLFVLAFLLRSWRLAEQPPLEDEVSAAFSASGYLAHGTWSNIMWEHPQLRNLLISASGTVFGGYSAWGLRGFSVLLGSLSVPLLGYLSYRLFAVREASYLAALFLCVDPLHISLSREAFQETATAALIIGGVLTSYRSIRQDRTTMAYLAGALFGLAAASKWHALFPWSISAACYLAGPWLFREEQGERNVPERVLTTAAAFAAVPMVLYTAVHLPWLLQGHSLGEFARLQAALLSANVRHQASAYAESILMHRSSLWFVVPQAWSDFVFFEGRPYLNIAMGNYLTWVLTLPALYLIARQWLADKRFETGYVILLFAGSYLPLVLTTRGIWVFNALSVIPFAFLLSSRALWLLRERCTLSRGQLAAYLGAVVLLTGLMYPLATFGALDHSYLKPIADLYSPH